MATAVCVTLFALVAISAAQSGVSIRLMGQELTSGISQVCLSNIGQQPQQANATAEVPDTVEGPALVCVTNNRNCCRPVDNPNGGGVGDWTINGFPVPGMNAEPLARVYRNRGTGLVRINYRPNAEGNPLQSVTGRYCCTIPDMSGVFHELCVDVIDVNNDTICNTSVSTTTSPTTTSNGGTTTLISTTGPPDTTTLIVSPTTGPNTSDNTGAVVGGIIGALLAIILVVVIVIVLVCLLTKRKKTNVTEVETFQTAMLQTENKQTVSGVYYSTIGESSITDGAVYAEVDKSHKTKRDTKSRSPAGNGSATDGDLADMYAVPDKKPYVNQPPKSVAPQADAEYAEIDKKDAIPQVPKKSEQLK